MNQRQVNPLKRLPARALLTAVTIGAVAMGTGAFAESTVTTKSAQSERSVIEKTISSSSSGMAQRTLMRGLALEPTERFIIALADPSVARYRGGIDGYEATSTEGKSKLDVRASNVQAYAGHLALSQDKFLQQAERALGRSITVVDQFQIASNAMIVELTAAEAAKLADIQGVRSIVKDKVFQLESTELTNGYAIPTADTSSATWAIMTAALLCLMLLAFFAYRRGWLGKNNTALVAIAASLGMAGCFYEGGFQWIGAPKIWFGSYDLEPTRGEGIVVGIIDTGINPISDSFAEVSDDGYRHNNPKGQYFGVCDETSDVYDATFPCNDKLIGAWGYPYINEGSPRDTDGHGSHTAGTAAGNLVYDATVTAPTGFEVTKTIAGVAPRSNVIAYTVCGDAGCYLGAILFAIDQAIADGVDVINYSIGGGSSDPWGDIDSLSFLAAMDAGIFVATSAGNSGPEFATLGSPADAPWITSVAASSHDYFYKHSIVDMVNNEGDTLPEIVGQSIAPGFGPAAIVDAADYGNPLCLAGEFDRAFEGEIVLCDAGVIARVAKGENVEANGGSALILTRPPRSPDGTGYLETDTHVIPATHITYSDAEVLREWLARGTGHMATLTGTEAVLDEDYADVLAYFSSRGVNPSAQSVVKPNITAPGRAIFAAFHEGYSEADQDYNIIQGTSMSSPHIAGAGALLTALRPDWSPMQIQSAMMTTASLDHFKEDGVTQADPFDVGGGRIDLPMAARAALLADETTADFEAADPFLGGNPADLNLTAMGEVACVVTCSWTRTVTNVADKETRWKAKSTKNVKVSPRHFRLAPGESIDLTFTADATSVKVGEWMFDQVPVFSKTKGVPSAHFPVAALSALSNLPAAIDITAVNNADTVVLPDLQAVEITDAMVSVEGLARATLSEGAVISDPTNGDYSDGGFDGAVHGQELYIFDIPAGATRFVAEITDSVSTDLDVFVGAGEVPGVNLIGYAATGGALEYVNVNNPPEGKVWVVVQNWAQGYADPAGYTLATAIVAGDELNMSVDVPMAQPAGVPFDAAITFNLDGAASGDRYYGSFSLGTDAASAGNLGTVSVDLVRQ